MLYKDIASELGDFTERQVRGWVNNHCPSVKIRKFNDSYFSNITTPSQAYWLGFIYADGAVVYNTQIRNYELTIELDYHDKYILEEFNKTLGNAHEVTDRIRTKQICDYKKQSTSHTSRIRIYSKRIVEDLMDNNIIPNKTDYPNYPTVSKELFWDFMRGYLDGDGCIYVNRQKPATKSAVHITSSHKEVFEYIQEMLKSEYGINSKIYQEKERKYRLMIITYEDIMKFLEYIYYSDDAIRLNRKYKKYIELALLCGDTEVINRAKSKEAC